MSHGNPAARRTLRQSLPKQVKLSDAVCGVLDVDLEVLKE